MFNHHDKDAKLTDELMITNQLFFFLGGIKDTLNTVQLKLFFSSLKFQDCEVRLFNPKLAMDSIQLHCHGGLSDPSQFPGESACLPSQGGCPFYPHVNQINDECFRTVCQTGTCIIITRNCTSVLPIMKFHMKISADVQDYRWVSCGRRHPGKGIRSGELVLQLHRRPDLQ